MDTVEPNAVTPESGPHGIWRFRVTTRARGSLLHAAERIAGRNGRAV